MVMVRILSPNIPPASVWAVLGQTKKMKITLITDFFAKSLKCAKMVFNKIHNTLTSGTEEIFLSLLLKAELCRMEIIAYLYVISIDSLADRWNYSALYDKSMKLVALILGIVGNVLKIRRNLDRSCGSWEGGEGFSIWPPFRL